MGGLDLTGLASSLGGRIRSCDHSDANLGEPMHQELRARRRGFRISIGAGSSRVQCGAHGFDSPIWFSVNLPDRVFCLREPFNRSFPGLALPVCPAMQVSGAVAAWLQVPGHGALVAALNLAADESLNVYRNGIFLNGHSSRASVQTLEQICDLAEALRIDPDPELVDGLIFDGEKVPAALQALEPLVRRFAVGDDELRAELLAEATPDDRAQLSRQVTPLLSRINAFLDTFGEPLSSEAILLDRLAEAVCEVNRSDA